MTFYRVRVGYAVEVVVCPVCAETAEEAIRETRRQMDNDGVERYNTAATVTWSNDTTGDHAEQLEEVPA